MAGSTSCRSDQVASHSVISTTEATQWVRCSFADRPQGGRRQEAETGCVGSNNSQVRVWSWVVNNLHRHHTRERMAMPPGEEMLSIAMSIATGTERKLLTPGGKKRWSQQ